MLGASYPDAVATSAAEAMARGAVRPMAQPRRLRDARFREALLVQLLDCSRKRSGVTSLPCVPLAE
jgi:hypothetical protein